MFLGIAKTIKIRPVSIKRYSCKTDKTSNPEQNMNNEFILNAINKKIDNMEKNLNVSMGVNALLLFSAIYFFGRNYVDHKFQMLQFDVDSIKRNTNRIPYK
jgi:hypothetical protein